MGRFCFMRAPDWAHCPADGGTPPSLMKYSGGVPSFAIHSLIVLSQYVSLRESLQPGILSRLWRDPAFFDAELRSA